MSWNTAIHSLLINDATLSTLFASGAQIVPNYVPDKTTLPHIGFVQLDNPKIDDDGQNWIRLRIFIYAKDFAECEQIRERIDPIFNNGFGTVASFTFANTRLIDKGASPVFNKESNRYETYVDVRLSYEDQ